MPFKTMLHVVLIGLLLAPAFVTAENQDESNWNNALKNQYFAGKPIEEANNVIELDAPVRAEDPALVPLKINTTIKQTPDNYIKKFWYWSTITPSLSSASLIHTQ